jgi:uncharacterized protein (TIGR03083 family)
MNEPSATDHLDHLGHLARESERFLAAVLAAAPSARVPTCPEWDADDLLWHLGEVQWFWSEIVRTRAADPDGYAEPERPAGRPGLEAFYRRAGEALRGVLAATPPDLRVWTWADDQSAGFVRRRQAHEALVHRVDAELTADRRTPIDPTLAEDGIDEVLHLMLGGVPDWATCTPDDTAGVRVLATDTGRSWLLRFGRFAGTSPDTGTVYAGEPYLEPVPDDGSPAAASLTGRAADLDCLLWNRPPQITPVRTGDARSLALLDELVAAGVQ